MTIRSFNPMTMVKYKDESKKEVIFKVDIYVGGKSDELKIYVDRPDLRAQSPIIARMNAASKWSVQRRIM